MFKKILIGVCFVMVAMLFTACSNVKGGPDYSRVRAYVSQDYYNKFDNKEFVLEDFELINASSFEYRRYSYDDPDLTQRFFLVYLSKTGKKYAQQAIDQLSKLEFVDNVTFTYQGMNPGELL